MSEQTETPDPDDVWRDQFSDYYDGELDELARAAFEGWLAADPTHQKEYDVFSESLDALHSFMPKTEAPKGFVREVTQDIRKQSRGVFFNDHYLFGYRVPYEVFAAIALILFVAIYFFGGAFGTVYTVTGSADPTAKPPPRSTDPFTGQAAGVAAEVLEVNLPEKVDVDAVASELRAADFAVRPDLAEGAPALVVTVPARRMQAFRERLFVATGEQHDAVFAGGGDRPVTSVRIIGR